MAFFNKFAASAQQLTQRVGSELSEAAHVAANQARRITGESPCE